jgi:hypothetical protein
MCYSFAKYYHACLPLAMRKSLEATSLPDVKRYETHLLTAMITVAAKDFPGGIEILQICSKYVHERTNL